MSVQLTNIYMYIIIIMRLEIIFLTSFFYVLDLNQQAFLKLVRVEPLCSLVCLEIECFKERVLVSTVFSTTDCFNRAMAMRQILRRMTRCTS